MDFDFSGWATKNDLRCSDGVTIRRGAFSRQDKRRVPLIWNHDHTNPESVIGHAMLEDRNDGVYVYGKFNKTPKAESAKEAVRNGDITNLSIWANNLKKQGSDVIHGTIREVSLVLAGANPGACIESVVAHGELMDEFEDEGIFYTDEPIEIFHAEDGEENEGRTIKEVYDTLNDEQKQMMSIVVAQAVSESEVEHADADDEELYDEEEEEEEEIEHGDIDEEGDDGMKFNVFNQTNDGQMEALSHAAFETLMTDAKRLGSFKEAVAAHLEEGGVLEHAAIPTTGMVLPSGSQQYGFNDPDMLFPDYRTLTSTPEWLSRNMDWVGKVLAGVHHTPFARIKSVFADITEDEARAKGYIKGKEKKEEVFTLLKRTTDPQTVYKKQKMDRDDVIDITDFDVLAWIRAEMRVMLNEEIARAILIGDGRAADSDDKIKEDRIRPIAKDVDLFNIKVNVAADATMDALIDDIIRSRKKYKGSGNPTLFTTEDYLTEMLLLKDKMGRDLFKSESELATKLRVKDIVTVEPMEGAKVGENDLIGIVVNLNDYNVGTNKGGEVTMFDDFDIDFNQYKYLLESRMSGALIKPFSAITITKSSGNVKASVFSGSKD